MTDKYERALDAICHMNITELQNALKVGNYAPSKYGITASDLADQILHDENKNKIKVLIDEIGVNDFYEITREIWNNEYN